MFQAPIMLHIMLVIEGACGVCKTERHAVTNNYYSHTKLEQIPVVKYVATHIS